MKLASSSESVVSRVQADARTLIVLQFRENYPLPSKAVVQNVMTHYGPLHVQDDIWFNKLKYLVYTRFKHEQDALTAYKILDKKAAWLFNMAEVGFFLFLDPFYKRHLIAWKIMLPENDRLKVHSAGL